MSDQPRPATPPSESSHLKSASWADDESDDEASAREFQAAMTPKKGERGGVAGLSERTREEYSQPSKAANDLASRIGGLSTSEASEASSSSNPTNPPSKPRTRQGPSANLFGKALAGIKAEGKASPLRTSTAPAAEPATAEKADPQGKEGKEGKEAEETFQGKELFGGSSESKGKMNIMDADDGWGGPPAASNQTQQTDGWGDPVASNGAANGNGNGQGNGHSNGNGAPSESGSKMDQDDSFLKAGSEAGTGLISNDFQVEVKLADLQADPESPLYSAKTFEELPLHKNLKQGIYGAGFKRPSKIQERALPLLLMNPPRNLIGQSQSGTGKTAAFTLNMLSRVDPALMTPQAICLAPSRELARQIQEVVVRIGQFTNIKTQLAVPGAWDRRNKCDKHILIGTPGSVVEMLSRGRVFDPNMIRVFVLDEADEMIAMQGLGDQTRRIQRMLPRTTQNVLFSATFPEDVRVFAESVAPEANKIFLKREDVTVDAIKQLYLECDGEEQKYNALSSLYDIMTIGQSIVFCERRATADRVAERLTSEGHEVAALHGQMEREDRDATLDAFRDGKKKVLITTNVIARGIDIQQVNMVVNYDIPKMGPEMGFRVDVENYIHRIGRFGRKGCAVTFSHDQRSLDDIRFIEDETGRKMKRVNAQSSTDIDQLEKALKLAMKGPA